MSERARKINDKKPSNHTCTKKLKTKSSGNHEITTSEESNKNLRDEFRQKILDELDSCVSVEDEKVLKAFRYHAISKFDEKTVQKFIKLKESGMCGNL